MNNQLSLFFILLLSVVTVLPAAAQREVIDVPEFDRISMGRSGTVYLKQGNETRVEILASDDVKEDLDIEVRQGQLLIKNKRSWGWGKSDGKLEVFVTTPDISGLSVSGSGKIIGENRISSSELKMAISGSGKIITPIEAGSIDISISGSGDAELSGTVRSLSAAISGSGGISGPDLRVTTCEIRISGSGDAELHVTESIDARISGSGKVRYHGSPAKVNSETSGSGSVKKVG